MNGLASPRAIERLASLEREIAIMRAEAYAQAGLPVPILTAGWQVNGVVEAASRLAQVTTSQIRGYSRRQNIVAARFAVMWVSHQAFGLSTTVIGRALMGRDHTTVINGCRRAEQWRQENSIYRVLTDTLLAMFQPMEADHAGNS